MRCLSRAAFNNFSFFKRRTRNSTAATTTTTSERARRGKERDSRARRTSNMTDLSSFFRSVPRMIFVVYCGVARSHSFVESRARHQHAINIDHYDDDQTKNKRPERSAPIHSWDLLSKHRKAGGLPL